MQESGAAHRTDFAVAKEAAQRHRAHVLFEAVGVVIGNSIEMFATPQATK